ncbi:Site-specific recombinase XerD [Methanococcoides vulcani]|uniref:Site-specific recombinase XerD n=1 Tax=Methanococcoides vulcani TaxID=1353158 RepID=A0A1I0AB83_9EURY|nr:site-specific integrase [Methanococcoides vulcani]SES90935.1 Site-specific recombinase XerD [Methanococcoides vulcani]
MTRNVDDVHSYDSGYENALIRLEKLTTSDKNKTLVEKFVRSCRRNELAKSTITNYINLLKRMIQRLEDIGYTDDLDKLDQETFDYLLFHLEDDCELSKGEIRNYKKCVKKFFKTIMDEDGVPRWVHDLKLKSIETPVQPSDLPTKEEVDAMLKACKNARDRAFLAILCDAGLRIGALASCRIKNVESNEYGSMIYISTTSRSKKTTPPKGLPLTWSSGYLQQWMALHPLREDPEAPLWVTLTVKKEPISYNSIRVTLKRIAKRAGVTKNIHAHVFRHYAITCWILDGLSEQMINFRAGWAKNSKQMYTIYANFTDQEMNDLVYEKYGLKTKDKRHVTLSNCPRCNNVLQETDRFCSQCNLVLDHEMNNKMNEMKTKVPTGLSLLLSDPEVQALLAEKMGKITTGTEI